MSRNVVIGVVAVLVLGFIGWNILNSQKYSTKTSPVSSPTPTTTDSSAPSATEGGAVVEESSKSQSVVKITSSGFTPQNITIKAGEPVVWVNEDAVDHAVNSAVHPTHQLYPRLNLGTIKPGDEKSLTFPDSGSYKYHDHLNPSLIGSVTVE